MFRAPHLCRPRSKHAFSLSDNRMLNRLSSSFQSYCIPCAPLHKPRIYSRLQTSPSAYRQAIMSWGGNGYVYPKADAFVALRVVVP